MKPSIPWQRLTAEFLVIFAGVVLGLLADDWRQDREDRDRERIALAEILADLEQDSVTLAAMGRRAEAWNEAGLWVTRNQGASINPDSAVARIRPVFRFTVFRPQRAAFVGLRDSAELDLIRSRELRRLIVEYYESTQPYIEALATGAMTPFAAAQQASIPYVRFGVGDHSESLVQGLRVSLRGSWASLSSDPQFTGPLIQLGLTGSNLARRIPSALQTNGELRSAIRGYSRQGPSV